MFLFLFYFINLSSEQIETNETKNNDTNLSLIKNFEQNIENNLKINEKHNNENDLTNRNNENEQENNEKIGQNEENEFSKSPKNVKIYKNSEDKAEKGQIDDKNTTISNERIQLENKFQTIDTDIKKAQEANKKFETSGNNQEKQEDDKEEHVEDDDEQENNKEEEDPKPQTYDWYDDEEERRRIPETPPPKRFPIVHVLWPVRVPVSGRSNFTIRVANCEPGPCFAKVDDTIVRGHLDNEENAVFKSPPHSAGIVPVSFSKDGLKWYGELQLEYVVDTKHKSNLFSFIGGLLIACGLSVGLFYFITGKKKLIPANGDKLKQPKLRQKSREAAPKKRLLPTV